MRGYDASKATESAMTPIRIMIAVSAIGALLSVAVYLSAPQSQPEVAARPTASEALPAQPEPPVESLATMNARLPARLGDGISLLSIDASASNSDGVSHVARIEAPEEAFERLREMLKAQLSQKDIEACKSGADISDITGMMGRGDTRVEIQDEAGKIYANMTWRNLVCLA